MISKYEVGHPCKLRTSEAVVLGRLVGESDAGSWGFVNGIRAYSIPLFATPHGTVIVTGVIHLEDLSSEESVQLEAFEEDAKKQNKWYNGRISHDQTSGSENKR
jgi:hypothetical protein